MGEDWQRGDLALCVKNGVWKQCWEGDVIVNSNGPSSGAILQVRDVGHGHFGTCLWFVEYPGDRTSDAYTSIHFRRIPAHTPDAEDAETIRLLTGTPAPIDAQRRREIHRALRLTVLTDGYLAHGED